jgi:hypothetical protein
MRSVDDEGYVDPTGVGLHTRQICHHKRFGADARNWRSTLPDPRRASVASTVRIQVQWSRVSRTGRRISSGKWEVFV